MATSSVSHLIVPLSSATVESSPVNEPVAVDKPQNVLQEKMPRLPKAPAACPSYLVMIKEAIGSLKERTGSSHYAIAKYLEDKYKSALHPNFKKALSIQLKKLAKSGKLTKVKKSFKLSEELKKELKPKAPKAQKTASKTVKKLKVPKAVKTSSKLVKKAAKIEAKIGKKPTKSALKNTMKPVKWPRLDPTKSALKNTTRPIKSGMYIPP
ncbi:unnamed protein product [Calypogeia fissa]